MHLIAYGRKTVCRVRRRGEEMWYVVKTIAFGICTSNVLDGLQRVAFGNREHAAKACHWLEGVASVIFWHLIARPWRS